MSFDFKSNGPWSGLTAARAIELVAHLPPTIEKLTIENAEFGREFMDALIDGVKVFHNLNFLWLNKTLVGGKDGGQEAGLRLAEVIASHTSIKQLNLCDTDLIGTDNVEQWGDALLQNKTLTKFSLDRTTKEIKEQLKEKTKDRSPKLCIFN